MSRVSARGRAANVAREKRITEARILREDVRKELVLLDAVIDALGVPANDHCPSLIEWAVADYIGEDGRDFLDKVKKLRAARAGFLEKQERQLIADLSPTGGAP